MSLFPASKFRQRFFSALFLGPLIVAIVLYGGIPFSLMTILVFVLSVIELFNMSKNVKMPVLYFSGALFYLFFCFITFFSIRFFPDNGMYLSLSMVLAIWSSDTGAYFTGKLIEGPKMAPSISPRKTWAGFFGAIMFPAILLWCLLLFAPLLSGILPNALSLTLEDSGLILLSGGAIGIIGQLGDLIVSFLKRKAKVKDSGTLIPGHGGLLDRIDSALLVSPYFLIVSQYVFI